MSKTLFTSLALAAALGLRAAPADAALAPQGDLLDRAVAAWAKVKTVRATFQQTIVNQLTGKTLTASGEYQQERPGKLSVSFADPANDRIVADGKNVWLYLPSSAPGQVIKTVQGADGTGTVDLTAQFLSSPRTRYSIQPIGVQSLSGHNTHGFTLTPKSKQGAPFLVASVWIDDDDALVRQFQVTELSGAQRTVLMTSVRTNVPVTPSAFRFTPPPGTRVVER